MKQVVDLRARVWFYFYLLLRVWFYEHFERCLNARRRKEGERGNHVNSYFCLYRIVIVILLIFVYLYVIIYSIFTISVLVLIPLQFSLFK